ncbi:hypothetical protein HN011_009386 [Eciton burchellii]|nr:hypothetical protein HN011_009386 [Eciton burchellii]
MFVKEQRDVPINVIREDSRASATHARISPQVSRIKFSFWQKHFGRQSTRTRSSDRCSEEDKVMLQTKKFGIIVPAFYTSGHRPTRKVGVKETLGRRNGSESRDRTCGRNELKEDATRMLPGESTGSP